MEIFWIQNLAYGLYIVVAFAFAAISWLNFDAYKLRKNKVDMLKAVGMLLIALACLLLVFVGVGSLVFALHVALMAIGTLVIMLAIHQERILPSKLSELLPQGTGPTLASVTFLPLLLLPVINTFLTWALAIQLWRRVYLGKMMEYRKLMLMFVLLGGYELFISLQVLTNTDVIILQQTFADYSVLWFLAHLLLVGTFFLSVRWVWAYIKFRVKPELFLVFASITVGVATLGAILYSGFLFSSTRQDTLAQMQRSVGVTAFAISSLQDNALTAARLLAQSPQIQAALAGKDYRTLFDSANLYASQLESVDSVIFTDQGAQVLVQTDDQSRVGQSLSNDQMLVYSIAKNSEQVGLSIIEGVLGNDVQVTATHPVVDAQAQVVGATKISFTIDDAFLDKVKLQTGMEAAVFVGNKRSATTIRLVDGLARAENTLELSSDVEAKVLQAGEDYVGEAKVLDIPYYAGYSPLRGADGKVLGVVFVGRPQQIVLDAIELSMLNTFLVSILLSIISIYPAYLVSRSLEKNYKV